MLDIDYEYKILFSPYWIRYTDLEEDLNKAAQNGWRLHSVTANGWVIMEREKS